MPTPTVAAREPIAVAVEAGESYWWCSCGLSQNQPFCDGSHADTGMEPREYVAEADGEVWFCRCKQTRNPPLCDGSHAAL